MGLFSAVFRFITTLGGLIGGKMEDASDSLATSPTGIKAAYRAERVQKENEFREVRDAIAQLISLRSQKAAELEKLQEEEDAIEQKMQGAVAKTESDAANASRHQEAFNRFFARKSEIDKRQELLSQELSQLDAQLAQFKPKLTEMQRYIATLDQHEAAALADIIGGQQIVQLNERLSGLRTGSRENQQLAAIERARQKIRGKVILSGEIAGTDANIQDQEYSSASMSTDASAAFEKMRSKMKSRASQSDSPGTERQL